MVRVRTLLSALGLLSFAAIHALTVVHYVHDELYVLALPVVVYSLGCLTTAMGLITRQWWARMMAVGIGAVALSQLCSGAVFYAFTGQAPISHASALLQVSLNVALVAAMSGRAMQGAFEDSDRSPWSFQSPLTRLARLALVAGIGAVPMMFSMAAAAAYSAPAPRVVSAIGGALMFAAHVLLLRRRSAGLLLLVLASVVGGVGVAWTVASFDRAPYLAGQEWYLPVTMIDATSAVAGIVLGGGLFAAFVPRFKRFLAVGEGA